jgi:hypothetical protein
MSDFTLMMLLSELELILGFSWAKLVGFLPPRLLNPITTLGEPSLTILGSKFFAFKLVATMMLFCLIDLVADASWGKSDVPEKNRQQICKGKSKTYKFLLYSYSNTPYFVAGNQ